MEIKANGSKGAVMVFSRNSVEGVWKWGEHKLCHAIALLLLVTESGMCI